jgi:hypothetical protein
MLDGKRVVEIGAIGWVDGENALDVFAVFYLIVGIVEYVVDDFVLAVFFDLCARVLYEFFERNIEVFTIELVFVKNGEFASVS